MARYDIVSANSMVELEAAVDAFLAANPTWQCTGRPFYSAALFYSQSVYS